MADGEVQIGTVAIPAPYVAPLIRTLGLVKSALFPVLGFPDGGPTEETAAARWWGTQAPADQQRNRPVLAACASPALVFDARVLAGENRMVTLRGIADSLRDGDPVVLQGSGADPTVADFRIVPNRPILAATLTEYLVPSLPVGELKFTLTLSRQDLFCLAGMADLFRRARFLALLDHGTVPDDMGASDVAAYVGQASRAPDPRWILPLLLSAFSPDDIRLDDASARSSLDRLVRTGVLAAGSAAGRYRFSEAGSVLADSLSEPLSLLLLDTGGATTDGSIARSICLFARSNPLLWFMDTGTPDGDTALVTACSEQQARDLVTELIRPVAVPVPARARPAAAPKAAPAPAPAAPAKKFCRNCGEPVKPGVKFCGKCGTAMK